MAIIFTLGLLAYYWLVLSHHSKEGSTLATLLWSLYMALGLSGIFIELTDVIHPVFNSNYLSVIFLLSCILISISGFLQFRSQNICEIFGKIRYQNLIENILIISQIFSLIFFLPFAISSLIGDAHENRIFLNEKMDLMGSFGLLNTVAGAASHLFSSSLVLAFIRFSMKENQRRNIYRAFLLIFSSFSYVIYILAYVGRDGVVYWIMTAGVIYLLFRRHLDSQIKNKITMVGILASTIMLIPFGIITISRFFDADQGGGWSFFAYFGEQIQTFSDYSSIDRPITLGLQNFPLFIKGACEILNLDCLSWMDIKDGVFQQYLDQGKEPWLFGTFVSDFVGDFGHVGALIFIFIIALSTRKICSMRNSKNSLTFSRLMLILFLFSIPYWGIFYFRFSIINGYIIINLIFILFVSFLQWFNLGSKKSLRH